MHMETLPLLTSSIYLTSSSSSGPHLWWDEKTATTYSEGTVQLAQKEDLLNGKLYNPELCWMGTSLHWKRSLVLKIKEWVLTNKRGLALKRWEKNENLEKKNELFYLFSVHTFFLLNKFLSLVSFGTFRTQIERCRPYMYTYIIGLSSLLLVKARIKESETTEKERVFPAHHCSLHIRVQCGIFVLI